MLKLNGSGFQKASEIGFSYIGSLSSLNELHLNYNRHLTDQLLSTICNGCPSLTVINLSGAGPSSVDHMNSSLTEVGFMELLKCEKLEEIDLSFHNQVSDSLLEALAAFGRLKTIRLRGCYSVSNSGALHLIKGCQNLWELDLSGCFKITNDTLQYFLEVHNII